MSSLGSLNIHLSLETAQFQQGLSKSTAQAQHFAKTFVVDMDKAQRSARQLADINGGINPTLLFTFNY